MSKRIDITGQIFNDIFVLEFIGTKNSHAEYKCLCMNCNSIMSATYSNLISGNTKSCASCGQKRISNGLKQDIYWKLKTGAKITHIGNEFNVSRHIVYRVAKEYQL